MRIGHAPHDHHAALYVAASKGDYFKEHHGAYLKSIEYRKKYNLYEGDKLLAIIDIDSSTGGINLIRRLDERILDMAFGGVPAMISLIDKGSDIKIIAPVMSEGASLVVANGMPVSNWNEFVEYVKRSEKPVRIGYKVETSVQNLIFEKALSYEKLSFSKDIESEDVDVITINMHGPKNLIPSLSADIIDGFVVMQPYPALAEHSGAGKIISELKSLPPKGKWEGHPCCALAAGSELLEKQRGIVEVLVGIFKHANSYIIANPEESAEIVAAWLANPVDVEAGSLPTINFMNEYTDEWDNGITYWVRSLIDKGVIKGEILDASEDGAIEDVIYDERFYKKNRLKAINED